MKRDLDVLEGILKIWSFIPSHRCDDFTIYIVQLMYIPST